MTRWKRWKVHYFYLFCTILCWCSWIFPFPLHTKKLIQINTKISRFHVFFSSLFFIYFQFLTFVSVFCWPENFSQKLVFCWPKNNEIHKLLHYSVSFSADQKTQEYVYSSEYRMELCSMHYTKKYIIWNAVMRQSQLPKFKLLIIIIIWGNLRNYI